MVVMATIFIQEYVSECRSSNGIRGLTWLVFHKNYNKKKLCFKTMFMNPACNYMSIFIIHVYIYNLLRAVANSFNKLAFFPLSDLVS